MKRHRTGFLVLMLTFAFAPILNSCSEDDEINVTEFTLPTNLILSNDGSSSTVNLALDHGVPWQVETKAGDATWCEITPESGEGAGRFVVTALPNESREARSMELVVTAGRISRTLIVSQEDTLHVSAEDVISVSNDGTTFTISVEANTEWEVIKPEWRDSWLTFTPAYGEGKVEFTVDRNPLLTARKTEMVFSAGSVSRVITIAQQDMTPTSKSDSLALVALYHATDGPYWAKPWNLKEQIATWLGVSTESVDGELRVTKLLITSRNLDGILPPEIGNLSELTQLDLSYNNLRGEITTEIGRLSKLKTLNITSNKFEGEIPLSIKDLSLLESINAQNNRFKSFPVEICQLAKLQEIHLENNEISSLPGEITEMSSLQYLYLANNKLTSLPQGLDKLPNLIYLHANKNQITEFPAEIGQLAHLVSLNLDNNHLESSIPEELSNLRSLKYLYLSNNNFKGGLPSKMAQMEALESIEAYNCGLTGALPEFGKDGALSNLKNIWITDNQLTGELTENLVNLTELTTLFLDDNKLTGTLPVEALGNSRNLPKLKSLSLSGNEIVGTIPAGLADRLTAWPAMTIFRLNGNYLQGPIPNTFAYGWIGNTFKFAVNLFPQRDGVILEIAQ